jgi:hypothetical protein
MSVLFDFFIGGYSVSHLFESANEKSNLGGNGGVFWDVRGRSAGEVAERDATAHQL